MKSNELGLPTETPSAGPSLPVRADLHIHSTCSDGLRAPAELARLARSAKLTHVALCDHDAVDGLAPFAAALEALAQEEAPGGGPRVLAGGAGLLKGAKPQAPCALAGVELSCGPQGQLHVLGYGFDPANPALLGFLTEGRALRHARLLLTLEKLRGLGVAVPEGLLPLDGERPAGRAHVARALIRMGVCNTVPQAFARYLAPGRPAYVAQERPPAREGVRVIRAAGGVPVLAHPMRLGLAEQEVFALLEALAADGLRGVEVYHSSSGRGETRLLLGFAQRLGLLVTGGSDYHGDRGASLRVGDVAPGWASQREDVAALWAECARGRAG